MIDIGAQQFSQIRFMKDFKYWAFIHQAHIYNITETPTSMDSFGIFQLTTFVKNIMILSTHTVTDTNHGWMHDDKENCLNVKWTKSKPAPKR